MATSLDRKDVEFATPSSPEGLVLSGRRTLAKDAGVSPDGTGSHQLIIGSDAEPFPDPDGWRGRRTALSRAAQRNCTAS